MMIIAITITKQYKISNVPNCCDNHTDMYARHYRLYIALHKPRGFVCSHRREVADDRLVFDLLPVHYHCRRILRTCITYLRSMCIYVHTRLHPYIDLYPLVFVKTVDTHVYTDVFPHTHADRTTQTILQRTCIHTINQTPITIVHTRYAHIHTLSVKHSVPLPTAAPSCLLRGASTNMRRVCCCCHKTATLCRLCKHVYVGTTV